MILYCSGPEEFVLSGHRSHGELFTVTADGAQRRNLSRSAATDDGAGWSPDGSWVVFHSDRGGSFDIWSVRADGRQLRRLTRARGDELWPQVGPDGKRLVFQTQHRDFQRIWLLELGGGTPRALTRPHFYARASFAPDGGLALVEDGRVSIVGLNGGKRNVGRADGYLDPVWSPDGRFLAAEVLEEPSVYSPSDVAVIAVGDGRRLRISGRGQFDQFGSWSPDARTLVFVRNGDDVLLADARSGAVRELDGI
jgi:Tol biopolymer transport system component